MSHLSLLPVPAPEICSQTVAEASAWYRDAITRIPECVDEEEPTAVRLVDAWKVKCRLRLAAALSLYDAEAVEEFFDTYPMPSVPRLLELGHKQAAASKAPPSAGSSDEPVDEWDDDWDDEPTRAAARFALDIVLGLSDVEKTAFPGTVGEAIGMTMHNVNGKSFVMTEEGWREQERIKASPILPHPGLVKSDIFPTSSAWADAPSPGGERYAGASLALFWGATPCGLAIPPQSPAPSRSWPSTITWSTRSRTSIPRRCPIIPTPARA